MKLAVRHRWRERIPTHLFESEALLLVLRWLLRKEKPYDTQMIGFLDNEAAIGSLRKVGRSVASFYPVCRRAVAILLAVNLYLDCFYIPSDASWRAFACCMSPPTNKYSRPLCKFTTNTCNSSWRCWTPWASQNGCFALLETSISCSHGIFCTAITRIIIWSRRKQLRRRLLWSSMCCICNGNWRFLS